MTLIINNRRAFLKTTLAGAGAALLVPATVKPAHASLGSFCPPGAGGGGSGGGSMGGGGPVPTEDYTGALPGEGPPTRSVSLVNPRNGETFNQNYVVNGEYDQGALEAFNWFARDWRHDDPTSMDPGLLDIFWALGEMLGTSAPFSVTSAYRNPQSNATVGGARQSYHLRGKAIDFGNASASHATIQGAARRLAKGGVGSYRSFTHVDTGPVRTWSG